MDTSGLDLCSERKIISGLAAVLKNATSEQLGDNFLLNVLPRLQHCLESSKDMVSFIILILILRCFYMFWDFRETSILFLIITEQGTLQIFKDEMILMFN